MNMKWLLTAVTATAIVATPALAADDVISKAMKESRTGQNAAQNSTDTSDSRSDGPRANRSSERSFERGDQSAQNERGSGHASRSARAMTQQKLRSSLKEAGFTQIRLLDAQYLIQARDDDGNTVFMAINPPSVENRGAETSGLNSNADADERADTPRGYQNEGAGYSRQGAGYSGQNAQRGWRNSSVDVYNRAYDEGFREGYRRGHDSGSGN